MLGFKPSGLESGGFEARAVEAADGRSVRELREAHFTSAEILGSGAFTFKELRAGSVPAGELKELGCTVRDLRPYGLPELRRCGFSAAECVESKLYKTAELRAGGFGVADLRLAAISAAELKSAGCRTVPP